MNSNIVIKAEKMEKKNSYGSDIKVLKVKKKCFTETILLLGLISRKEILIGRGYFKIK
jgi:hypothetical protein